MPEHIEGYLSFKPPFAGFDEKHQKEADQRVVLKLRSYQADGGGGRGEHMMNNGAL